MFPVAQGEGRLAVIASSPDLSGVGSPHPALRATFYQREKGPANISGRARHSWLSPQAAQSQRGRRIQRAAGVERGPTLFAERLGALAARDRCVRVRGVGLASPDAREPSLERGL